MTTAEIEPGRFGLSELSRVPLLEAQELIARVVVQGLVSPAIRIPIPAEAAS